MSINEGLTFVSAEISRSLIDTFAFCPRGHLHLLNITIPEYPKSPGNIVWPPESLDHLIANKETVLVAQLRLIRVQDCPCLPENPASNIGSYNPMPMIRVGVNDVNFLAHITNSAVDYISDVLYNFLHSREPGCFQETGVNLPKYVDPAGNPVNVQRQATIPFRVKTNKKRRKLAHLIVNVIRVDDEINAVCVLGSQFLEKLDGAILTVDQIQVGAPERKEYVPFVQRRYSCHQSLRSICSTK